MNASAPAVSVVVPLFNKSPYVKRCIDSILGQTLRDFEVIVVDDGSTDGGAAIVRACEDPRVRVIVQENAGPGAARNSGVREARAQYVAFLDADDEWMPAYLERALAALQALPHVAAVSFGYTEEARNKRYGRGLRDGEIRLTPASSPRFAVRVAARMSPCATIVRRGMLERYGGFNASAAGAYGEDNELWLKILLNETVAVYAEPLMRWHSEASALSRNTRGPRAVEVFLLEPRGLYESCPPAMRELLRRILAIRAGKTACMLSFWGQWRQARALMKRFCTLADARAKWVLLGYVCATPLGACMGCLIRGCYSSPLSSSSSR